MDSSVGSRTSLTLALVRHEVQVSVSIVRLAFLRRQWNNRMKDNGWREIVTNCFASWRTPGFLGCIFTSCTSFFSFYDQHKFQCDSCSCAVLPEMNSFLENVERSTFCVYGCGSSSALDEMLVHKTLDLLANKQNKKQQKAAHAYIHWPITITADKGTRQSQQQTNQHEPTWTNKGFVS
mmetsp:Transcript_56891/g.138508  ORF Transcript_56891/g.138508 Transcript_56891/m.138508 type:complete len:179 (+) Transcript_56891:19-555(+)